MDYCLADMLGEDARSSQTNIIAIYKENETLLADPLQFKLPDKPHKGNKQIDAELSRAGTPYNTTSIPRLRLLPNEIVELVLCSLDFKDARNLIVALRDGEADITLSRPFWQSRFFAGGEAAFARFIRPSSYTWKEWFVQLESEIKSGPSKTGLQNRQRIWKLGVQLGDMVRVVNNPYRSLHGGEGPRFIPIEARCSVSCVALEYDTQGCRELIQVYANLGHRPHGPHGPRVISALPTYTMVASRRLISGLTFTFSDGRSVRAGYVVNNSTTYTDTDTEYCPEFLWLVFSSLGLEAISLGAYSQSYLQQCSSSDGGNIAVSRWPLHRIRALSLGLDVCPCMLLL